jgi:fatty acid/phospholipid biosynthesis enzyme
MVRIAVDAMGGDHAPLEIVRGAEAAIAETWRGGAALVGVEGACIICHGKSDSRAIKNAIAHAKGLAGQNFNEHIKSAIGSYASHTRSNEP